MHGITGIRAQADMVQSRGAAAETALCPVSRFFGPGQGTDLPNCCIAGQAGEVAGVIAGSSALSIIAFPALCLLQTVQG